VVPYFAGIYSTLYSQWDLIWLDTCRFVTMLISLEIQVAPTESFSRVARVEISGSKELGC
jgi:hypothetical protein